jgi:hypothetical protein
MIADLEDGIGVVVLVNGYVQSYGAVDMAMHMLKLLRVGLRGEEMPPTPVVANPQSISNAADYAGTYSAGEDRLTVTAQGEGLSLQWRGLDVGLQRRGVDSFYLLHPDLERHLLEFGRDGERVVEVLHGPDWYVGEEYSGPASFDYPVEWEGFTGHYRAYNFGLTNFRIVLRKGSLLLVYPSGGHEPLVPLGEGLFRIGEDLRSPETIRFDAVASGRALRVTCSGCPYYRTYTP